jgi:hypothetical protein
MGRCKHIYRAVLGAGVLVMGMMVSLPQESRAVATEEQMANWPAPMYQGEELEKMREWEKTWVGKKVNQDMLPQVKDFLSEQFYGMYSKPEDWGAEELWFEIVPYRQIKPTPGTVAMTKKYAPTAKLDPKGRKAYWDGGIGENEFLMGWDKGEGAGFPFPFPETGIEVAWNLESVTRGDEKAFDRNGVVVNPRTRTERRAIQPFIIQYFTGRCDYEPVPKFEDNPKGIRRGEYLFIEEPLDVRGTRYMELRYLNPNKPDDVWIWFPLFRRIRRMGYSYKSDTIDGSDLGPDDAMGWNGHVNRKNWEIIGRKEMLLGRHTNTDKYVKQKGQAIWSGLQLERTNAVMLESRFKGKDEVYSKEMLYMDPETWRCLQKVTWDRQGRVWRHFFYHTEIFKDPKKDIEHVHTFELYSSDLQRRHGCPSIDKIKQIGLDIDHRKYWTIQNLQKLGY